MSRAIACPSGHELAAFFEQIATPICGLGFVGDDVGQRHFAKIMWKSRGFRSPVPERRPEPCTVISAFIRRNSMAIAMVESGLFRFGPGKTYPSVPLVRISPMISIQRGESGTRCSRAAFMRDAGMAQTFLSRSISSQLAPSTSLVRHAVRIANSKARAAIAGRRQRSSMKAGTRHTKARCGGLW